MGEVYRARDPKLDRDVAIKVLPLSVAADPDTLARFEREAKAVAALSHPNILSIFDFGTHDGVPYAVMELLKGETLRGKLDAGAISEKQAVDYALQMAKGLSAAHEQGIVHRDLKPENLFVSKDSHLKILDFGLAKKIEATAPGDQTSSPTASGHTEPGTIMGTVDYMSPEQVKGLPVDHRSDIFAFGTVFYELLSGTRAFRRNSHAETMSAIMRDDPPDLSASGRNISPSLDRIVRHCLEKERDNRFQSAKDIAFAMSEASSLTITSAMQADALASAPAPATGNRKALLVAAAILVLAVAGVLVIRSRTTRGEVGGVKRVAVLPFENMGAPEDDYFADGIADEVRSKLTSIPGVEVIARASSTPYRKTTKTPRQIAEELDVRYLLTATVRWQKGAGASRVHVIPELVEVRESGAPAAKWQQPYDAALTDVFQVQSEIASHVVHALGVALGAGDEKRLAEKPTQNLAAYDAFLRGEEASSSVAAMDPVSLRRALPFYEQAVALDPDFAQAWARLARASAAARRHVLAALAERARQGAERAVALAPNHGEGHLALGDYQRLIADDPRRALEQYREAQRLSPGNAEAPSRRPR